MTSTHTNSKFRTPSTFIDNYFKQKTLASQAFIQSQEWLDSPASDPLLTLAQELGADFPREALLTFLYLRDLNLCLFHQVEGSAFVEPKPWAKEPGASLRGGGIMAVGRGQHLEKCAVNLSLVAGDSYPALEGEYAGKPFVAAGVSLICHPHNPHAPIAHMNVRVLRVGTDNQQITWMGGGADLTPCVPYAEDTELFHGALKKACQSHEKGNYQQFKEHCDRYFFIPHRGEARGVGGIFFDYVPIEGPSDLGLLSLVGQHFAFAYHQILMKRVALDFDAALKDKHLYWRGRYAEFNLVHDRGTRFGLLTGGNIEAIFASLPPLVRW